MRTAREYARELFLDWERGMTSGASLVLAIIGVLAVAEGYKVSSLWFFIAAAVCFFISSYKVWKREHLKLASMLDRRLEIYFMTASIIIITIPLAEL